MAPPIGAAERILAAAPSCPCDRLVKGSAEEVAFLQGSEYRARLLAIQFEGSRAVHRVSANSAKSALPRQANLGGRLIVPLRSTPWTVESK